MRIVIRAVAILLTVSPSVLAQTVTPDRPVTFGSFHRGVPLSFTPPPSLGHVQADAEDAAPAQINLKRFRERSDWPDYNNGYWGNGVVVAESEGVPRSEAAVGIELRYLSGGGCVTVSDTSADCLTEPDGYGGTKRVMKERERWFLRFVRTDPSTGVETTLPGGSDFFWTAHTSANVSCFSMYVYGCNLTGQPQNELGAYITGMAPSCSMTLGGGYRAEMFYQYSRYTITDPNSEVWEPAAIPATSTKLAIPGKLIFRRNWSLGPGADAVRVATATPLLNPSVPLRYIDKVDKTITNVGGKVTKSIAAGQSKLVVDAIECGVPFGNLAFTGEIEFQEGGMGHVHGESGAIRVAPTGKVSDVPSAFSGVTDNNGHWESPFTITAGEFAGFYKMTVTAPSLSIPGSAPVRFTSRPVDLLVGFRNIYRFNIGPGDPYLKLVGSDNSIPGNCETFRCDNHRDRNHYGTGALQAFIRQLPEVFHDKVEPDAILGINDMSLPYGGAFDIGGQWGVNSHISHRLGHDVDVNRHAYYPNGTSRPLDASEIDEFSKGVKSELGGTRVNEPSIHFRLPASTIDSLLAGGY